MRKTVLGVLIMTLVASVFAGTALANSNSGVKHIVVKVRNQVTTVSNNEWVSTFNAKIINDGRNLKLVQCTFNQVEHGNVLNWIQVDTKVPANDYVVIKNLNIKSVYNGETEVHVEFDGCTRSYAAPATA